MSYLLKSLLVIAICAMPVIAVELWHEAANKGNKKAEENLRKCGYTW